MIWDERGDPSRAELRCFLEVADEAGRQRVPGACRFIRANEVWMAPPDSPVRPSKSDQRQELVAIVLWDEDAGLDGWASFIEIQRDANGKARAGAVDIMFARVGRADLDQIYGPA
jgi:hypothetical protein